MKKLLYVLMLAVTGTMAHAQVKIGANPGTIGSSSGLEVEATNGKKTIVDKATGQVTIQDGTEGAGKILTSDANGGSSWVAPPSGKLVLATMPDAQTTPVILPANGTFVNLGATLTLPPGKWLVQGSAYFQHAGGAGIMNMKAFLSSSPTSVVPPTSISNTVYPGFMGGAVVPQNTPSFDPLSSQIIQVTTTTTFYILAQVASNTGASGINGLASLSRNVAGTAYLFAQSLDI